MEKSLVYQNDLKLNIMNKSNITKDECFEAFNSILNILGLKTNDLKSITRDDWRAYGEVSEHVIRKLFGSFVEFKEQAYEYYQGVNEKPKNDTYSDEDSKSKSFSLNVEKYSFNETTQQYRIYCPSVGGNIVLDRDKVESLKTAYSNFDKNPSTINEICKSFQLPRKVFIEIKDAMGWTHDSMPVTNEQLFDSDDDEQLVEDLIQQRYFSLEQKYKKRVWREIEDKASKFDDLLSGLWDPFKEFLSNWVPPTYDPLTIRLYDNPDIPVDDQKPQSLVVNFSDIHFGKTDGGRKTTHQSAWTINDTMDVVKNYADELYETITESKITLDSIYMISLGDILDSLTGFTEKGTRLNTNPIGEELFELAFNTLVYFIDTLYTMSSKIDVPIFIKAISGNHTAFGDWALFFCLQQYYKDQNRINFDISEERWMAFKIQNNMICFEHGYSPYYKNAKLPSGGARETFIQNIMVSKRFKEMFAETDHHYYLVGDQHHVESKEYSNFEFIMMPSITAGGEYEDHNLWISRQRQIALLFDQNGLKQQLYFYYDA